jgi:large conductance mechanosensitive channel
MFKEFKEFAVKGNVVDLATGVIIGAAFGGIVTSLVNDLIMPPIGVLVGGVDFKDLFVILRAGKKGAPPYATLQLARDAGAATLNYGMFINTVLNFLIIAAAIFVMVQVINRIRRAEPKAPDPAPRQEVLLEEIRDLLKQPPATRG